MNRFADISVKILCHLPTKDCVLEIEVLEIEMVSGAREDLLKAE